MKYLSADPVECLYRQLAGILTRSGFEQIALDAEAMANRSRLTAFVMDTLKVDIDPALGPSVDVLAHDGLISADWIGWCAHFGPATPVEVIAAAALAARVVETRGQIIASIQRRRGPELVGPRAMSS